MIFRSYKGIKQLSTTSPYVPEYSRILQYNHLHIKQMLNFKFLRKVYEKVTITWVLISL